MTKTRILTMAELPPELEQAWLQHLRDFDTAHPECHFAAIVDSDASVTIEEMEAKIRSIEPAFRFVEFFEKSRKQ